MSDETLLHLLTARPGESDVMRWWRTDGISGLDGVFVGPRLLTKTDPTGRTRHPAMALAEIYLNHVQVPPRSDVLIPLYPGAFVIETTPAWRGWPMPSEIERERSSSWRLEAFVISVNLDW
jgi:hypothetical protein